MERVIYPARDAREQEVWARAARLGAYICLVPPQPATSQAGGLNGWTVAVKDNIHVSGVPNTAGTAGLKDFVPSTDAPVITALRAEGANVVAKANMHELSFGVTSNNVEFGPVRNPHDESRSAGGSSGGSAVLVAIAASRIAIGTDTGGSIRVPAAATGVVGFRPSVGRYPATGITPLSTVRDTPGVIARSVEDVMVVDRVLSGTRGPDDLPPVESLTLGIPSARMAGDLDPTVRDRWEYALERLRDRGVALAPVDLTAAMEADDQWGVPVVVAEVMSNLEQYLHDFAPHRSIADVVAGVRMPDVSAILAAAPHDANANERTVREARRAAALARSSYADALRGVDAIVFPTTPAVARLIGSEDESFVLNGRRVQTFPTMVRNTSVGSFAGVPGASIPIRRRPGQLPVGFALDGAFGGDDRLLAVASALTDVVS